ncbi:MAG: hypothetical protein NC396_01320 [Bacteroides sp.]|nr:hypothetical protein [Bacteroides sp.]MCM1085479.1 hypothetical protein [Bacteroides sp.]
MKRIVALALTFTGALTCVFAQNARIEKMIEKEQVKMQKELIQARSKQVNDEIKKYSQDGWVIDGTAKSVSVSFREYYQKMLLDPNYRELQSNAQGSSERSLNLVQNIALNNAMVKYAQEAKSHVQGRVTNNMGQQNDAELENFYSAYERLVSADIEGELQFQFGFYRDDQKTKKREYVAFYLINEEQASQKRIKAMENALKETKAAQNTAEEISLFIKEGFRTDENRNAQ